MKLTKTQWIIVAVVAAIAIWYFVTLSKRKNIELTTPKESGYIGQKLDGRATVYRKNLESGYREKLGPKSTTGTSGTTGLHLNCPQGRALCTVGTDFKCCCTGPGPGCSENTEPTVGV